MSRQGYFNVNYNSIVPVYCCKMSHDACAHQSINDKFQYQRYKHLKKRKSALERKVLISDMEVEWWHNWQRHLWISTFWYSTSLDVKNYAFWKLANYKHHARGNYKASSQHIPLSTLSVNAHISVLVLNWCRLFSTLLITAQCPVNSARVIQFLRP